MLGNQTQGKGNGSGELTIKVIRGGGTKKRSMIERLLSVLVAWWAQMGERTHVVRWKVRNLLTTRFLQGWISFHMAFVAHRIFGWRIPLSELRAVLIKADGRQIDYGIVSHRVLTDAFIAMFIDDLDNGGADISAFNFHAVGTGTTAEAAGDTALVTESTTILTNNSVRATGTRSQPTASQYRSVATQTFDGSGAITEHGITDDADAGQGNLMDRSVFSAINVVTGDGIQFTYTYTQTGS
jgi:hypothetical protein